MNDMSSVIVPKSDQINADDFIAGPRTITIREVKITGGQEQPVSMFFDGSEKAFRPCKSMCRVLVQAWGADAKAYVGRSLTLYRDPSVKWGGLEVGGIRISHMSDIEGKMQMQLTATRGQRKPHIVMPLVMGAAPKENGADRAKAEAWLEGYLANPVDNPANQRALTKLQKAYPDLYAQAKKPPPADDWAGNDHEEGPADEQRGGAVSLADAKDQIAKQTNVDEINRLTRALEQGFDDAEQIELRGFAAEHAEKILQGQG